MYFINMYGNVLLHQSDTCCHIWKPTLK
uniref:Uncharacterized protein n=1 Tax=Anopheles funestus TaxID=62324 RepID=A0A182S3Z0_ANOFN